MAALALLVSCATPGLAIRPVPEAPAPAGRLFEAARRGELARVRRMVEQDPALLRAEDRLGWNALAYAAWAGRQGACPAIDKGAGIARIVEDA